VDVKSQMLSDWVAASLVGTNVVGNDVMALNGKVSEGINPFDFQMWVDFINRMEKSDEYR
jgi:hypothetical protein